MLKQLREQTKSLHWVLWLIILSFILLIFVQWGGGGRGGRTSDVWAARVGDDVITAREFYDEFQQQENRLRQLFGAQYDRSRFLDPDAVLESLIQRRLLRREAERLGVEASDQEVARTIRELPSLQGDDGRFDRELYERLLAVNRLTARQFEELIRRDLVLSKMESMQRGAVTVSEEEVEEAWRRENETATIDHVLFPLADFRGGPDPTEDDLAAWHEAHAEDYDAGPGRLVRWVEFDREALQAELEDEAEMRAYHEENAPALYTMGPDQRRARRILIESAEGEEDAARARAEALAEQTRGGADFAELAREHSDDEATREAGGDLGPFYAGANSPIIDEAVFSASEGDVIGPLESDAGFEILLVTKGEGEKVRPFEEVRDLVARGLYAARAAEAVRDAVAAFQEAYAETLNFEQAAAAAGVEPHEPTWVTRGDRLPEGPGPQAVRAAFELEPGDVSDALRTAGGQAVIVVLEERESSPRTLDEAREAVEADWRDARARERAREAAETTAEQARVSGDVAQAAEREVATAGPFRRGQPIGDLGRVEELSEAAFEIEVGTVGPVTDTPEGPVVFVVTDRVELKPDVYAQARPRIAQRLRDQRYQTLRQATLRRLRKSYEDEVEQNPEVLMALRPDPSDSPLG